MLFDPNRAMRTRTMTIPLITTMTFTLHLQLHSCATASVAASSPRAERPEHPLMTPEARPGHHPSDLPRTGLTCVPVPLQVPTPDTWVTSRKPGQWLLRRVNVPRARQSDIRRITPTI